MSRRKTGGLTRPTVPSHMAAWSIALVMTLGAASYVRAEERPLSVAEREALTDNYDQPPRLKKQTKPMYPLSAYQRKVQGTVHVEFVVDEAGRVREAYVIKPKEPPKKWLQHAADDLYEAALRCVREWTFEPARRNGEPVATIARAPVSFRIGDEKTPTSPP